MTTGEISGVCAKCGRHAHIGGEEGRYVCEGCDLPLDLCTCSPAAAG